MRGLKWAVVGGFGIALILLLFGGGFAPASAAAKTVRVSGAGASFPAPVYGLWMYTYAQDTPVSETVELNYQSMGSSAGIRQLESQTVQFGATDDPVSAAKLEQHNWEQFPMIIGGIVPVVHLPGIPDGRLILSGEVMAEMYCGAITRWNDRAVRRLNPGLELPDLPVQPVFRSDGSGTTAVFSHYLCGESPLFKREIGEGKTLRFPVGVGGQKNPGVAALVKQLPGAIGYVEYSFAVEQQLQTVRLRNPSGHAVLPDLASFASACLPVNWAEQAGKPVDLTASAHPEAWPIVSFSYIVVPRTFDSAPDRQALCDYFRWCLLHGDGLAQKLHYTPLPEPVKTPLLSRVESLRPER